MRDKKPDAFFLILTLCGITLAAAAGATLWGPLVGVLILSLVAFIVGLIGLFE